MLLEAREVLAEVFGYPDFRPGQADAVAAVLSGRDAVVLLPTGSGKSICYQVPALVLRRRQAGTTLVVSPLIALMNDQVAALEAHGVQAAALHSHQQSSQQHASIEAFERGELDLLYVSPERSASRNFRSSLQRATVALLAIDEAHCVSQWGHDFRPDYLRLGELREQLDCPVVALTATATQAVVTEIETELGLRSPVPVRSGFARPNLEFAVLVARTQKMRLAELRAELDSSGLRPSRGAGRGIVYCSTRKTVESIAKTLRSEGFAVSYYHAGRTKLARERAQRAFDIGRTRVLVATNAFGMGVDLPDIRLIVHFQTPGSVEAYYQEAGRAGRDGEPARCVLYFGAGDLMTQRRLSQNSSRNAVLEARREKALEAIERYATSIRCRHQALVAHFTAGPLCSLREEPVCGRCDVCVDSNAVREQQRAVETNPEPVRVLAPEAKRGILAAVGRLRRPVGKTNLARALRGSRAKSLARGGLLTLPEYGSLAHYSEADIVAAVDELLDDGSLKRTGRKYPTVWIPGKSLRSAVREPSAAARRPNSRYGGTSSIARALDNYRRRKAKALKWKTYMVFQRKVILEIDRTEPQSLAELERIPGLGPAKVARFGDDILELVRAHRRSERG
ncbi:MAG: ATP-dependent DNA helicase RecQ [Acidobacteriota bacterium]|nr:MAG: ATP-dependent DNA helicase RecQ [Acidobacteriota bacterium]